MITATACRDRISALEARIEQLRPIVAQQEYLEYDPDTDGCESCFDPETDEMKELYRLEREQAYWTTDMAFIELYDQQPAAVKEDDDVDIIWWNLRRRFVGAPERRGVNEFLLQKAALRAIKSPNPEVRTFMRALVHAQNRCSQLHYFLLPREFMHAVVAEGLMENH